jgi:hypothetical protein
MHLENPRHSLGIETIERPDAFVANAAHGEIGDGLAPSALVEGQIMRPIHLARGLSVGLSKAVVSRFAATVLLAVAVAVGTGGCLLVPFPVPVGGGHHHHR